MFILPLLALTIGFSVIGMIFTRSPVLVIVAAAAAVTLLITTN